MGRVRGLDGLRGLAACGVAFFVHFFHVGGVRETGPLLDLFAWVYLYGETLVDLFFVLSGYVIAHVCWKMDARTFALRRVARLYPLHIVTLCMAGLLLVAGEALYGGLALTYSTDLQYGLLQLGLLHGVIDLGPAFNAPSWSIAVEAVCYALFLLVARSKRPELIAACLIAVGIVVPVSPWLARGLVGFFAGVLILRAAPKCPPLVLAAIAASGIAAMSLADRYWLFVIAGLWAWPALLLLVVRTRIAGWLDTLKWLGDRSYGIYMVHTPVQLGLLLLNDGQFYSRETWPAMFVISVIATLAAADLSYRYLEVPTRRLIVEMRTTRVRRIPK